MNPPARGAGSLCERGTDGRAGEHAANGAADGAQGRAEARDDFRVDAPAEIVALFEQLFAQGVPLSLAGPGGARYRAPLAALEPARGVLCLAADEHDPQLQALLESDEITATAFLDSIKLQFELQDLVLVHGGEGSCALKVSMPRELYRFQRRGSFRVCPLINARPTALLAHPQLRDMALELKVVDVSLGGVALFVPENVPSIEPGLRIERVRLELDGDTRLQVGLMVHHVTLLHQQSRGVRLGCELLGLTGEDARALQLYIDQTQKKRRLLAL